MQRILSAHRDVSSAAEPWIMLPLLYSRKEHGTYTEYLHREAHVAFNDFISVMRGGDEAYCEALRDFVIRLYTHAAADDTKYFMDKTPRYHLIADEIISLFPQSKCILLWRNPLAVAASIIETFAGGKWNIFDFRIDLYRGLVSLCDLVEAKSERLHVLCYESLVSDPDKVCRELFRYLDLEFDSSVLNQFRDVSWPGSMGDQTGRSLYREVSDGPVEKWKTSFGNPLRQLWARKYLRWLGKERLEVMGYEYAELVNELDSIPLGARNVFSDARRMVTGELMCTLEFRLLRSKLADRVSGWPHCIHD